MPTGESPRRAAPRKRGALGITYLLLLFWLAIAGTGLAAAGTAWSTAAQRGKEAELRFRGEQYRRAIESYQRSTPGGAPREPLRLDELLDDRRGPAPRHHLRRLYADPFTGTADWELVRNGDRIRGVHSRAKVPVLRAPPGSPAGDSALASDWMFVAADAASAPAAKAASQGNAGPFPSFLDPLGGPDVKRQVWGRSAPRRPLLPASSPSPPT